MHEQGLDHACTAEFVVHKLKLGTVHAQQKHATCPQCETWPAGSRQPGDVVGWWVGRQPLMKRFLTLTMIQRVHLVRYGYRITLLQHTGNKQHSALGERIDPVKKHLLPSVVQTFVTLSKEDKSVEEGISLFLLVHIQDISYL